MTAWGSKVTISIYGPGDELMESQHVVSAVAQMVAELGGAIDFVGIKIEPVEEQPTDQVAS